MPCSVCEAAYSTTIMLAATLTCPAGWTVQYTGHLSAGNYGHPAAIEFVCLDADLEDTVSGKENREGHLFYYTLTKCGSLPCPSYVENKVATCVVCSN